MQINKQANKKNLHILNVIIIYKTIYIFYKTFFILKIFYKNVNIRSKMYMCLFLLYFRIYTYTDIYNIFTTKFF